MDGPIEGPSRSGSDQSRCNRLAVKYCWLFYTNLVYYDPNPVDQKAHGGWGTRCRQLLAVCERGYAWRIALKEGRIKPRLSSFQKIFYIMYTNLEEHTCTLPVRPVLKWVLKPAQLRRMSSDGGDSKGWIRPPIFCSSLDPWLGSGNFFKFSQPAKTSVHSIRVQNYREDWVDLLRTPPSHGW